VFIPIYVISHKDKGVFIMNSFQAFANGEAARRDGAKLKVFDWNKAARLIKEHKPVYAGAGLRDDWE
jgi:hypothetical protein